MGTSKTLYEKIIEAFPALAKSPDSFRAGVGLIMLQNDGDGDYIAKWEYSEPLPAVLKSYLK
jgi:hypothetical protein